MHTTLWKKRFLGIVGSLLLCGLPLGAWANTLSYAGSADIGTFCLPELIQAFTAKTGLTFSKVQTLGSTEGFKAMMGGEVAMVGMARLLTAAERGQKPYGITFGFDLYVVYVHAKNPLKNLSEEQLKDIFTGKITDWQEVGGPSAPIAVVIGDPKIRSTVTEFRRTIMENAEYAPSVQIMSTFTETLNYVAQHEHAITFASTAQKPTGVQVVTIDNVVPSLEAVRDGTYRFQRPMSLMTKEVPKGDVQKFFAFVQSQEGQAIVGKYFMPAGR